MKPLSDYRLGRIIIWPFGQLLQFAWFLFCVFGTAWALAYAWIMPKKVKK